MLVCYGKNTRLLVDSGIRFSLSSEVSGNGNGFKFTSVDTMSIELGNVDLNRGMVLGRQNASSVGATQSTG